MFKQKKKTYCVLQLSFSRRCKLISKVKCSKLNLDKHHTAQSFDFLFCRFNNCLIGQIRLPSSKLKKKWAYVILRRFYFCYGGKGKNLFSCLTYTENYNFENVKRFECLKIKRNFNSGWKNRSRSNIFDFYVKYGV